jgi:hypothetical protein
LAAQSAPGLPATDGDGRAAVAAGVAAARLLGGYAAWLQYLEQAAQPPHVAAGQ